MVRFPKEVILLAASPSGKPVCLPVQIFCDFFPVPLPILIPIIHGESLVEKILNILLLGTRGSHPDVMDSNGLTIIRSSVNIYLTWVFIFSAKATICFSA